MPKDNVPSYEALMNPVIQALKSLGGSGTVEEISNKVAEIAGLTNEQLEILHLPEKGGQTKYEYTLGWSRSYLKRFGIIENSSRGVWSLTGKGNTLNSIDPKEVVKAFKAQIKNERENTADMEESIREVTWRDELREILIKMSPPSFEKLTQRVLRESGFSQVEVTGRSGDGGIDGKGVLRLNSILSFPVIFQCKKYQGSVGAGSVRDFRGAMIGRADKGLLITTGTFTKDAIREATRDGAPAIDLVDGEQFLVKLKELGLGAKTTKIEVEEISVDSGWFASL